MTIQNHTKSPDVSHQHRAIPYIYYHNPRLSRAELSKLDRYIYWKITTPPQHIKTPLNATIHGREEQSSLTLIRIIIRKLPPHHQICLIDTDRATP